MNGKRHYIFEVQQLGPTTRTETFNAGALGIDQEEAERVVRDRYPRAISVAPVAVSDETVDELQRRADEIAAADRAQDEAEGWSDEGCPGHPASPFDPMGETVYCDGTCQALQAGEALDESIYKQTGRHPADG